MEQTQLQYMPQIDYAFKADDFEFVDIDKINQQDRVIGKPTRYVVSILKRFISNKYAVGMFLIIFLIILLAIFAPVASPYSPYTALSSNRFAPNLPARPFDTFPVVTTSGITPTDLQTYLELGRQNPGFIIDFKPIRYQNPFQTFDLFQVTYSPYKLKALMDLHPLLGTDLSGIDIWTRLWTAVGLSLGTAVAISLLTIVIGVIYGAISGAFAGTFIDTTMMRFVDIVSGVPTIVWLLILGIAFANVNNNGRTVQTFDTNTFIFSLSLISWFGPAYTTRTYILKNKDVEFAQVTKTFGGSFLRVIFSHLLPIVFGRILVIFVNLIPGVIFFQSSLSFLGLVSITQLSFGVLLNAAITTPNITLLVAPIIVFSLLTISAQIVANGLNDAIDPRVIGKR